MQKHGVYCTSKAQYYLGEKLAWGMWEVWTFVVEAGNLGSQMECKETKAHKLSCWKFTIAFRQGEDNGSNANGVCKGSFVTMFFLCKNHIPVRNQFSKTWKVGCKEVSIAILARAIAIWVHSLGTVCCKTPQKS